MGEMLPIMFRCKRCGAAMGYIRRPKGGEERLVLYRQATKGDAIEVHSILAIIHGGPCEVSCSLCGASRRFEPCSKRIEKAKGLVVKDE